MTPDAASARQLELQSLVQELATSAVGAPIDAVRARLAAELHRHAFAVPSESWLDAVAREAVHGNVYAVSTETLSDLEDVHPEERLTKSAPAKLRYVESPAPARPYEPPPSSRWVSGDRHRRSRSRVYLLAAALAWALALLVLRRWPSRRQRREPMRRRLRRMVDEEGRSL